MMSNERQVDLLVLGGGAAGMTAALTAAVLGLDVLLVEKTERVGGTSARSAGSLWVPNSRHSPPGSDSPDNALRYLRAVLGNRLDETRARAFLDAAPEMVAFLEDNSALALRAYAHHPDYRATLEGATLSGRVLEPVPFDASVLTNDFAKLRPPLPEFMLLGGMMVDRPDITHLLNARRSFSSLRYSLGLLARYGADRLRFDRGARLVMGNALVARLYYSLLRRRVPILVSTQALSLTQSEGRVTGALLQSGAGRIAVRTRAGVVLATGGFSHNLEMRRRLLPAGVSRHSPSGRPCRYAAAVTARSPSFLTSCSIAASRASSPSPRADTALFPKPWTITGLPRPCWQRSRTPQASRVFSSATMRSWPNTGSAWCDPAVSICAKRLPTVT